MSLLDYTFIEKQEMENLCRKVDILKDRIEHYHIMHNSVTPVLKTDEAEEEIASLKQEVEEYKRKRMEEVNKRVEMAQLFDKQEKVMKGIPWSSVANVLPEENQCVLCLYKNGPAYSDNITENVHFGNGEFEKRTDEVVYWMPLPETPKEC